jgi:threonine/homoserine/homoserine lactone efflux protein
MDRELLTGYLAGNVDGLEVSQGFLLGAGVLVEIPIAMVLLSRVLKYRANRWANVAAGTVMTIVQLATLFLAGSPTMYYLFFSVIEIATTAYIFWLAWKWSKTAARMEQRDAAVPAPTDAHIPHA